MMPMLHRLVLVLLVPALRAAGVSDKSIWSTHFTTNGSTCAATLQNACWVDRHDIFSCVTCCGQNQQRLEQANCSNGQISRWCSGFPVDAGQYIANVSSTFGWANLACKSWTAAHKGRNYFQDALNDLLVTSVHVLGQGAGKGVDRTR